MTMIRHGLALSLAFTLGAASASAESAISADGLKATESSVTVPAVTAEKAGYVVVHATDFTGTIPGSVIGHAPVTAGENADIAINLERTMKSGAKLIVMLHEEGNNDTQFDKADPPATSGRGPVQQSVTVE